MIATSTACDFQVHRSGRVRLDATFGNIGDRDTVTLDNEMHLVGGRGNGRPRFRAAGLPHRDPYAMRHTFASWAIAAGLPTFEIAATMGTSLEQLSKTYAHLLPDSADRARVALDAYINQAAEAAGRAAR